MKINKFDSNEMQVRKMLFNVQRYMDKSHSKGAIKTEQFARDLYIVGRKCKGIDKENILTNCLDALAEKMKSVKQDNLAGIIYSFLIKFNENNPMLLKEFASKALCIAKKQKDSVHVAARTGELCQVYKTYDIHGENYLACLNLRKKALNDICSNYDTVGKRFRTISRKINTKDTYNELLIRTKLDIARELIVTNKPEAKKELLAAYRDFQEFSDNYKENNERTYCMLKKHISTEITNLTLCQNSSKIISPTEKFMKIRRNLIEATNNKEPIENTIFNDYYSSLYDEFKNSNKESWFVKKSIELEKELNSLGNPILGNNIYITIRNKNSDNVKNLKDIIMTKLDEKCEAEDDFGVLYFGTILQKLFKKDSKAISVNTYLKSIKACMDALTNIINNYETLPKNNKLKTKNEYIEQLIFAKVNSAKLQKNTNPEYAQMAIKEAGELIDSLSAGYLAKHPEMKNLVSYVMQFVD